MTITKTKEIFMKYFYDDDYENSVNFMRHVNKLIRNGLITSDDGKALTKDDAIVKELIESNEFKAIVQEKELFDQFYQIIETVDKWKVSLDEPTMKIRYMKEPELTSVTFYAEVICDAPMVNVLALFSESDLFHTWFPKVTGC